MNQPNPLSIPFAKNAGSSTKNEIPVSPDPAQPPQQATWEQGFPLVTMQPPTMGGIPPQGGDFNGVLNALSEHTVFQNAGGMYKFNSELANAIGGYSKGAVLISDDGETLYRSLVDGNSVNPNVSGAGAEWAYVQGADEVIRELSLPSGAGLTGFSQSESYVEGTLGRHAQQSVIVNNQRGAFAIAGTIRRDPSTSTNWETIQDAAHKPLNWVGPTGGGVDQRIEFTGGPVGSIVIGVDETFAKDGVAAGISGGNGGALISMSAPCTFEANLETLQITRYSSRYYAASRFSISRNSSTGLITLTHPGTTTHQMPLIQYRAKNSQGEVLIPSYVTSSGIGAGTTSFFLVGAADGAITYTGSSWSMTGSAWSAADIGFEWDSLDGVLKVNHPRVLLSQGASPRVQVSLGGSSATPHFLIGFDVSETSFKVKFRTLDNQIPSVNTGMGFYFSRGMTAIRKEPIGSVMVDIGRAQVNMSHVDAPSGNLWCLGINNIS